MQKGNYRRKAEEGHIMEYMLDLGRGKIANLSFCMLCLGEDKESRIKGLKNSGNE